MTIVLCCIRKVSANFQKIIFIFKVCTFVLVLFTYCGKGKIHIRLYVYCTVSVGSCLRQMGSESDVAVLPLLRSFLAIFLHSDCPTSRLPLWCRVWKNTRRVDPKFRIHIFLVTIDSFYNPLGATIYWVRVRGTSLSRAGLVTILKCCNIPSCDNHIKKIVPRDI